MNLFYAVRVLFNSITSDIFQMKNKMCSLLKYVLCRLFQHNACKEMLEIILKNVFSKPLIKIVNKGRVLLSHDTETNKHKIRL